MRRPEPLPTIEQIRADLRAFGIEHVGVTSADVLVEARGAIHDRIDDGLHDGMGFTFRNPERSTDPTRAVPAARSVIVAARSYLTDCDPERPGSPGHAAESVVAEADEAESVVAEPAGAEPVEAEPAGAVDLILRPYARVGRYAWVDHYAPLRLGMRSVAKSIRRADHRAVAFADDNSMVDRAVARRAGLGWFGKNANLLLPGLGSWFVLGSIVTTAHYEPTERPVSDGCGTCTRCLDGCPTNAIIAPGVIDAGRCLSWILQKPGTIAHHWREVIGDRIYGCDDCQDVCPISVRLGRRETIAVDDLAGAWVDALCLLDADDDWIAERYAHWYVAERDYRWVRRNALVVIGNVGAPDDTRCHQVLERYRSGPDPILAEHAAWAQERLTSRCSR